LRLGNYRRRSLHIGDYALNERHSLIVAQVGCEAEFFRALPAKARQALPALSSRCTALVRPPPGRPPCGPAARDSKRLFPQFVGHPAVLSVVAMQASLYYRASVTGRQAGVKGHYA